MTIPTIACNIMAWPNTIHDKDAATVGASVMSNVVVRAPTRTYPAKRNWSPMAKPRSPLMAKYQVRSAPMVGQGDPFKNQCKTSSNDAANTLRSRFNLVAPMRRPEAAKARLETTHNALVASPANSPDRSIIMRQCYCVLATTLLNFKTQDVAHMRLFASSKENEKTVSVNSTEAATLCENYAGLFLLDLPVFGDGACSPPILNMDCVRRTMPVSLRK